MQVKYSHFGVVSKRQTYQPICFSSTVASLGMNVANYICSKLVREKLVSGKIVKVRVGFLGICLKSLINQASPL